MTYKAGASTLRRSLPFAIAQDWVLAGASVNAFDSCVDWSEMEKPVRIHFVFFILGAAKNADAIVLLTDGSEFVKLDFKKLKEAVKGPVLLDIKNLWAGRAAALKAGAGIICS